MSRSTSGSGLCARYVQSVADCSSPAAPDQYVDRRRIEVHVATLKYPRLEMIHQRGHQRIELRHERDLRTTRQLDSRPGQLLLRPVVLDGQLVQSMSGGAHWGGRMIISARDMARFGYLTLRKGKWGDKQVLSKEWIRMATTPGVNAGYGFMNYFLNTGRRAMPSAPEQSFQHRGAGNNIIYVDPVNDLVVVARWIDSVRAMDGVFSDCLWGASNRHRRSAAVRGAVCRCVRWQQVCARASR